MSKPLSFPSRGVLFFHILSCLLAVAPLWANSLAPTGSLHIARHFHSATLLADGKVLVAGGTGAGGNLASAEVYNPATGQWALTGTMSQARSGHTATRLANGRVLVAGGGTTNSAAAELYDPATGTWSPTGVMAHGRSSHTATLLSDGRVLVVGGFNGVSAAELYHPASGTWASAGSLATGRRSHTATLMADGSVLVVGGETTGNSILSSTERYDPASNTWSVSAPLPAGRRLGAAARLPDGRLLFSGGQQPGPSAVGTCFLFNPVTATWTSTAALSSTRFYHQLIPLPNGRVLATGGTSSISLETRIQIYDPATGTWISNGEVTPRRQFASYAFLNDGRLLIAGGNNPMTNEKSAAVATLSPSGTAPVDTVAPVLVSASIEPTSVDLNASPAGATVRVLLHVTDASGVFGGRVEWMPWSGIPYMNFTEDQRISGTPQDGVYELYVTIPRPTGPSGPPGSSTLYLNVSGLEDTRFNIDYSSSMPATLEVTGEFIPPSITGWTLTPESVEVYNGNASTTMDIRIINAADGLSSGSVVWRSPDGMQEVTSYFGQADRISGNGRDGIYRTQIAIQQGSLPGNWNLVSVSVTEMGSPMSSTSTLFAGSFPSGSPMTLQVTSTPPPPEIGVEQPLAQNLLAGSSSVVFGSVKLGDSVSPKVFTIRNSGPGTLNDLSVSILGTNAGDFQILSAVPGNIASGETASFSLRFTPGSSGLRSAILRIASNDPDENPFDVALQGSATVISSPSQLVKDISAGTGSSMPYLLTRVGEDVYFVANDGVHGYELWKSDGTTGGTVLVEDILPGAGSSSPQNLVAVDDLLFFTASSSEYALGQLWRSDGTPGGTFPLTDFSGGSLGQSLAMGGLLYFTRSTQTSESPPWGGSPATTATAELWRSNGTAVGTILVTQDSLTPYSFNPYASPMVNATFSNLTSVAGVLYFTGIKTESNMSFGSSNSQYESLWKYSPTSGIPPSSIWSHSVISSSSGFGGPMMPTLGNLAGMGQTLYFHAPPSSYSSGSTSSAALWRVTNAGGVPEIVLGTSNGFPGGSMVSVGSKLYFSGSQGNVWAPKALWQSDGSPSGTTAVPAWPSPGTPSDPFALATAGDHVYFISHGGSGSDHEPWVADPATGTARKIKDIRTGVSGSYVSGFAPLGDTVFFLADDGVNGVEIWKSAAGGNNAFRLSDLGGGGGFQSFGELLGVGNKLFFAATTASGGRELFVYHTETNQPDIMIESPSGSELASGASYAMGAVAVDASQPRTFTIRNIGNAPLSGLLASIGGTDAEFFELGQSEWSTPIASGTSVSFTVRFLPTDTAVRDATLVVLSNDPDESPYEIHLSGQGTSAANLLETVFAGASLVGPAAEPDATPFGDGTSNLLKYAFNMNLSGPDYSRMESSGASGLPSGGLAEVGGETVWQVQFVRRKGSGLNYVPKKSSTLTPGSFVPMTGAVAVETIDHHWERVTVNEACDPVVETSCFSVVEVVLPP